MSYRIKTNTGCNHLIGEPCERCEADMAAAPRTPAVVSFPDELVMEHAFDPWDPVRPVSSREELRQLCNKQGVTSHYLRDSMVWKTGETRWV